MENYVVYKITCITDENIFYIGSTNDLKKRIISHRAFYKTKNHRHIYQCIDKNGGFDNFEFTIIETLNNTTKREAERREQHYITTLNPVMNDMKRCYITHEDKKEWWKEFNSKPERKKYQKEYSQVYREENKEKLSQNKKEYAERNRDKIREERSNYRERNKEEISKRKKEYYEKNKDKINEFLICECGCNVSKRGLLRHKKTQKHITLMNELI